MVTKRILTLLFLLVAAYLLTAADNPPPMLASDETEAELSVAFFDRLNDSAALQSLTFDLFTPEVDVAFTSSDGQKAVLWLALRDNAGRLLATEPGLALATLTDEGWQVLLPGDQGWEETLAALPQGMLPLELSPAPESVDLSLSVVTDALTGYYLPYAAGTARWLEGSISHFQSIPELGYPSCDVQYCRYAYDFTDTWHFPLVASRDGKVVASRDTCSDGNPYCTNFIVLRDTSGQTFQIYLHLAQGTIPDKLTPDTEVLRGQYLGDSDDTGYSTSNHVHFMVTDSLWTGGDGYYWGTSIDVRFADVTINNGTPRTCYEVTKFPIYGGAVECLGDKSDPRNPANDWFVSGNVGAYPPTGKITRPAAGATIASGNSTMIDVTATASDDVRVAAVSLAANIDGEWVQIGPKVTQAAQAGLYDWDVDLCAFGPLNGPLEIALRVWDHEGNMSSALDPRTIQVDHACPPPSSQLTSVDTFDSTAVRLNWDASSAGAGFGAFEIQWRTDPGAWDAANSFFVPGNSRSAWFAGQPGGSFAFRLRALDINGQVEPWPAGETEEIKVTLPAGCTPDKYEPDDNSSQARILSLSEHASGNLCGPGDPDWYQVTIDKASNYFVSAPSLNGGAAVRTTVYAGDSATVVASGEAGWVGQTAGVRLPSLAPGKYYVKVEPLVEYLSGSKAEYGLEIFESKEVFLPLMAR